MRKIAIENRKNSVNPNLKIFIKNFHNIGQKQYNVVPLSSFRWHKLICGTDKREAHSLIQDISSQLYNKVSSLGQLIIQTSESFSDEEWIYDTCYDLNSLKIPYRSGGFFPQGSTKDVMIDFINAIFGLWYEIRFPLAIVLQKFNNPKDHHSLIDILLDLKHYLKDHPYTLKRTIADFKKIDKGIEFLKAHPRLREGLSKQKNPPEWLEGWSRGKTISVDLRSERKKIQQIVIAAIFNCICQSVPTSIAQVPSGIIILDEYSQFFQYFLEKPYSNLQLIKWFEKVVRDELRYRYIGIITSNLNSKGFNSFIDNTFQKIIDYRRG